MLWWEFRNLQKNVIVHKTPTFLYETNDWSFSTEVSVDIFDCVQGYSVNIFQNMLPAFVIF